MGSVLRAPNPTDAALEGGFGRNSSSDRPDPQPRVPIIGLDSGAIPGTKPQPGCSGAYLDRCGRDLLAGKLRRTRRRDHRVAADA